VSTVKMFIHKLCAFPKAFASITSATPLRKNLAARLPAIEIPHLTRFTLLLLMLIQCQRWRNHHATTILNFLVARIAAIVSLIQFDFDKSRNCPDTVMKKAFPPSLPPFSKRRLDNASVIFPLSSVPASLYCILKC